ncbi:hypothetical protein [Rubritalea tangerina]
MTIYSVSGGNFPVNRYKLIASLPLRKPSKSQQESYVVEHARSLKEL